MCNPLKVRWGDEPGPDLTYLDPGMVRRGREFDMIAAQVSLLVSEGEGLGVAVDVIDEGCGEGELESGASGLLQAVTRRAARTAAKATPSTRVGMTAK